jgi:hypothetical protein
MSGILFLGLIISSCTKENDLEFSDNLYQADYVLKSRKVNDGSLTPLQQLGREFFLIKFLILTAWLVPSAMVRR